MLVVNLLGGPGCGKSTLAAHVFAELKWDDINCELVTEAAKDAAWEGHLRLFEYGQLLFFGEQYRRLRRLDGQVDVVVTDSPLILELVYANNDSIPSFLKTILEAHNSFDNLNFLVRRVKEYIKVGRNNEDSEARQLDSLIEDMLQENRMRYKSLPGVRASVPYIVLKVKERLGTGR